MKYLITERQLKLIKEQDEILKLDFDFFNKNWNVLQKFLERRGNPPYIITGDLDLSFNKTIKSLGNLQSVVGDLNLYDSKIKSLENLQSVGGFLNLYDSKIESLGNLQSVGGYLYLKNTPLSKTTTEKDIRDQVEVGGSIYL